MNLVDKTLNKEKAFLIGVHPKEVKRQDYEYSLDELESLAETAGVEVKDIYVQALSRTDSATHVGKGKLEEIMSKLDEHDVNTLIFNDNLTSSQAHNIAKKTKCNVVDRTELILDIFVKHAQTHEAKLQVELAQLEYSYTKLRNLWQHFSRIAGGMGVRGPGETQIEIDRRLVRKRISILKDKLNEIKKTTETKRKKRANQISVCLIGYTNAGKSTLFNALTKENIYTANKLFATLDATTKALAIGQNQKIVLTDTIGFIENLPHSLVQSFYSTLTEVRNADLLLHVVDINNPQKETHIETVDKIMTEINACEKDTILVFNKCDKFNSLHNIFEKKHLLGNYIDSLCISAKTGENLDELKRKIEGYIIKRKTLKKYIVPATLGKLISFLHENTEVQTMNFDEDKQVYVYETLIDKNIEENIQKQLDKASLYSFVNS